MSHAERQAYLKKSGLADLFGVADLLPEVGEETPEVPKESSRLKYVRGLFKNKQSEIDRKSANDKEITS